MITTLTGNNVYELEERLKSLRDEWQNKDNTADVEVILGEDIDDPETLINNMQSVSLFSAKRLVIIRHPSDNKTILELIEKYGSNIPEEVHLVIYEPNLDQRTKAAKWLKKNSDFIEKKELDPYAMKKWLENEVNKRKIKLSSALQSYILGKNGLSQTRLHQELVKLQNIKGEITAEIIDDLVPASLEDNVFDFLDAFISGRKKQALKSLADFERSKMDVAYVFNMIIWQLNIIAAALTSNEPVGELAAKSGLSYGALSRARQLRTKLDLAKLKRLIHKSAIVDDNIKKGEAWRQLEMLVMRFD